MIELIQDEKGREFDPRGHPKGVEHSYTEAGSHIATQRGYAEGRIIEPGEAVPPGIAVAEEWMDEVEPKAKAKAKAKEE